MALRGRGAGACTSARTRRRSAYPRWGAYGVSKAALEHLGAHLGRGAGGHGRARAHRRPGRDGHAHARATRCPRPTAATLARPEDVAARLLALLGAPQPASGRARGGRGRGGRMRAAAARARTPRQTRLLHLAAALGRARRARARDLPTLLRAGDLLVVNDAATLPASLQGRTAGARASSCGCSPRAEDGELDGGALRRRATGARAPRTARLRRCCSPGSALALRRAARRGCSSVLPPSPRLRAGGLRRAGRGAVGRALPRRAARCSTRTSRGRSRSGTCRPPTPRAPGRSRCPRRGGR